MEYQAFVSVAPWTVIIQAANLLILTAIFGKLLFRPVQNILALRRAEVENMYKAADNRADEAQRMYAAYEYKLRNAEREAAEMKKLAEKDIARMKAEALDRAEGEAAHIRETAKRQTEQERKKAAGQLRAEASNLAAEMAEKIIGREINAQDQQRLIEEFLSHAELGK